MKKLFSGVVITILLSLFIAPQSINAQAVIPANYTKEQKIELILSLIQKLQAQLEVLKLIEEDRGNPQLTVLTPNGGERWLLKNRHTITWTPEPETEDVIAYLDRKLSNGKFEEVGEIIADARGSIHWRGEINNYSNYANEGEYYVRLYNIKNGQTDRSDAPFYLVSAEKENITSFTVNGQNTSDINPLKIDLAGESIDVAWSTKNSKDCVLSYGIDNRPIEVSVPTSGTKTIFYKSPFIKSSSHLTLRCAHSNATGNFSQLAYISASESSRDQVSINIPVMDEIKSLKIGKESDLFEFKIDEGSYEANLNYIRYYFSFYPWDYFDEIFVEYDGDEVASYNKNTHPNYITESNSGYDLAVFLTGDKALDIDSKKEIVLSAKVSKNAPLNSQITPNISIPWIGVQGDIETGQGYALPESGWSNPQYFRVE